MNAIEIAKAIDEIRSVDTKTIDDLRAELATLRTAFEDRVKIIEMQLRDKEMLQSRLDAAEAALRLMQGSPKDRLDYLQENNIPFNIKADDPDAEWIRVIATAALQPQQEQA